MPVIDSKYFKEYRAKLGFSDKNALKSFLSAKDVIPDIDFNYLDSLNNRLHEIILKLHDLVVPEIRVADPVLFCKLNIDDSYEKLKKHGILPRLNNQGRRPEEVYYSWMRGFVISAYFVKALSVIFDVDQKDIDLIGEDDLVNIERFKRAPKADLQINLRDGNKFRIEVQSGFQGINDIKQHKVLEARKTKKEVNVSSMVIHFDLFNGQVAFVGIDDIEDNNINWITRQQMEGQTVFNIDQNDFVWKLTEFPPKYADLIKD